MKLDLLKDAIVVVDVVGSNRKSLDELTLSTKDQGEKGRDLENPNIMMTEKGWKSTRGKKCERGANDKSGA
ncbi:MAG: hypothetical protein ACRD42_00460 [Nitrososphaeraceae archaeon]